MLRGCFKQKFGRLPVCDLSSSLECNTHSVRDWGRNSLVEGRPAHRTDCGLALALLTTCSVCCVSCLLQDFVQARSVDVCGQTGVRLYCAAVSQPQRSSAGSSRVCSGTAEAWRPLSLNPECCQGCWRLAGSDGQLSPRSLHCAGLTWLLGICSWFFGCGENTKSQLGHLCWPLGLDC